jgi:putative transposase
MMHHPTQAHAEMTATLDDVTPRKRKPGPSAEEQAAAGLVRLAKERGLSRTRPNGLLKQLTRTVLETALNEEMTQHLGHEKRDPAGVGADDIRNGDRDRRAAGPGRHVRAADRQEAAAPTVRRG